VEFRKFFPDPALVDHLKRAQKTHWDRLFTGRLGDAYVRQVITTAEAHIKIRLPTYYYMAAYAFFLDEMHEAAYARFSGKGEDLTAIIKAVNKLIMIDMDLTLSVYTKRLVRLSTDQTAGDTPQGRAAHA